MEAHVPVNSRRKVAASLVILLSSSARAQVGTITQDISTLQDFSLQQQCVQTCFQMNNDFCPIDALGMALGCVAPVACSTRSWQAKNDCYCRLDFQQPAQDYLAGCVEQSCSVGDPSVAAASAGSIYLRYCEEKGYDTTKPASNEATTTGSTKATSSAQARATSTGTPSAGSDEPSTSSSKTSSNLSTAALVGIIAGAVGTLILAGSAFWLHKLHESRRTPQPHDLNTANLHYFNGPGNDVYPDDSVSHIEPQPPHPQLPPPMSLFSAGYGASMAPYSHVGTR